MHQLEENNKGFTTLEVIVVLCIVGILSAISFPRILDWNKARAVKSDVLKAFNVFDNINSQVQRGLYAFVQVYIIYKEADTHWRQCKNNLGLMLKEGLLKENIDGEAISWAFNRLKKRKEERKILMVISDGAPVDDSTLSVNSGDFLEKHLKKIVKFIEEKTETEILAIGIGHDVSRYYNRAIKITDVNELGDVMISQLSELFKSKKNLH